MKSLGLIAFGMYCLWGCLVTTWGCADDTSSFSLNSNSDVKGNDTSVSSFAPSDANPDNSISDTRHMDAEGWQQEELPNDALKPDVHGITVDAQQRDSVYISDSSSTPAFDGSHQSDAIDNLSPDQSSTVPSTDTAFDTSADTEENEDVVDLPPIKEPLCQDECTTGTKVCTGTTTYLHCGYVPEGCKKMKPGKCNSNAQCIDGECYCAPTGELECNNWNALHEQTVCGTMGKYVETCPYPGCYWDQCVSQPPVSYLTPWPTGSSLTAVSVLKEGYVVVGWDSGIVHKSPTGLVNRSIESWSYPFGSVLAYTQNDVYAMVHSVLFHFDGDSWKLTATAEAPPIVVKKEGPGMSWSAHGQGAMWGVEAPRFYSVGGYGTIYYYDGESFEWIPNPHLGNKNVSYRSIWGSSDTDIYAVGEAGAAVHYDGKSWKPIPQFDASVGGLGGTFRGVHGRSKNDVYLVREKEIWHFDGATWSQFPDPPSGPVYYSNVFAPAEGGLYVTAGITFTYAYHDGTKWFEPVKLDVPQYVRAISGNDYGTVMVGDQGLIVELNGADHNIITKHLANSWPIDHIHDLWGFEDDTIFAAGDFGTVIRKEPDGTITQWDTPELLPTYVASPRHNYYAADDYHTRPWNTIWGSSPSNMYVGGVGIVRHFGGKTWTTVDLPGFYPDTLVMAIYGTAPNDIYISGKLHYYGPNAEGYLAHFDGVTWKQIPNVPSLGCLWGRDPDTWYGVGWAPASLFSFGVQGVINQFPSGYPAMRCHIAGLPTGEVLYGWGCINCVVPSDNLRFLDASGQLYILATFYVPPVGIWDMVPTPNHHFALIWGDNRTVMNVDVDLLYEGVATALPGSPLPLSLDQELVMKPQLKLPGADSSMWWSTSGKIYLGGNNNLLLSAP